MAHETNKIVLEENCLSGWHLERLHEHYHAAVNSLTFLRLPLIFPFPRAAATVASVDAAPPTSRFVKPSSAWNQEIPSTVLECRYLRRFLGNALPSQKG